MSHLTTFFRARRHLSGIVTATAARTRAGPNASVMKDATTRPSARASRSARTTTSTSAAAAARRTTRRRRGPSPRRSRQATTRRRTSPPSRRTGGSRARRRSAAATRCSLTFHDLPLPRRDCRASLRSGPVAPLPRGAVARHALRCRPLSSSGVLLHSSRVMSRSLLISLFYIFPCRRRRFVFYKKYRNRA